MPEFVAQHTPNDLDAFTRGYLDCAEWLLDEQVNRSKIHGWTKAAIKQAKKDCEDFQRKNSELLDVYKEVTGRDMGCAGHDFFLTRNGHGSGFWDRKIDDEDDGDCLELLSEASRKYGASDTDVYRGWIYWF